MKHIPVLLIGALTLLLVSCGGADNKADTDTMEQPKKTESAANRANRNVGGVPATPAENNNEIKMNSDADKILAGIDQYILSTASFNPLSGNAEGISNGLINIKNTLANTSFEKLLVEVDILLADGQVYRTDYYPVVNLEPRGTKVISIPHSNRGASLVSRVIKAKSNQLTHGEFVLTGDHYAPKN